MHAAAQIDMNVHYIDDVVVKSMKNYDLLVDLDRSEERRVGKECLR